MPVLTVKGRYLALIRSGRKTSTIRLTCKVTPGDLLTFSDYRHSVRTTCTAIERVAVRDLTDAHAQSDGFTDRADLIAALRTHYPTLRSSTDVFVVRFVLLDADKSLPLFTHSGRRARN